MLREYAYEDLDRSGIISVFYPEAERVIQMHGRKSELAWNRWYRLIARYVKATMLAPRFIIFIQFGTN